MGIFHTRNNWNEPSGKGTALAVPSRTKVRISALAAEGVPVATFRRIVFTGLGWTFVCASAINVCAQNRTSNCFLIRIQLNGKSVEGPQSITLKTKIVKTVSLESGCFHLPQSLIAEKALDIYFTVPENKIYLSGIDPSFFNGTWDIELEDKKFPKSISLPKNARVQKACAVIFHIGEPEITISQTGCRSPAH